MELNPAWVAIALTAVNVGVMVLDRLRGSGAKFHALQSRQEQHEAVCALRQTHIAEALERLEAAHLNQGKEATTFRHSLAKKLTGMEVAVRVICHRMGWKVPTVHTETEHT